MLWAGRRRIGEQRARVIANISIPPAQAFLQMTERCTADRAGGAVRWARSCSDPLATMTHQIERGISIRSIGRPAFERGQDFGVQCTPFRNWSRRFASPRWPGCGLYDAGARRIVTTCLVRSTRLAAPMVRARRTPPDDRRRTPSRPSFFCVGTAEARESSGQNLDDQRERVALCPASMPRGEYVPRVRRTRPSVIGGVAVCR